MTDNQLGRKSWFASILSKYWFNIVCERLPYKLEYLSNIRDTHPLFNRLSKQDLSCCHTACSLGDSRNASTLTGDQVGE